MSEYTVPNPFAIMDERLFRIETMLSNLSLSNFGLNSRTNEAGDKFLTIQEAADFLHLSINTIYGLTSRQVIPFMKTGKKLIFLEKDLIAYIKNTRQKTVAEIESDANAFLANQGSRRKVPTPT